MIYQMKPFVQSTFDAGGHKNPDGNLDKVMDKISTTSWNTPGSAASSLIDDVTQFKYIAIS